MNNSLIFTNQFRDFTDPYTGLVPVELLASTGGKVVAFMGPKGAYDEWLDREQPLYEVAFRGMMYRLLRRPEGAAPRGRHEVIRSKAPGLKVDGQLLESPSAYPNTINSMIAEISALTGATQDEVVTEAFDILAYRFVAGGAYFEYPPTMEPSGYRLDRLYLLQKNPAGAWVSLYENPGRVNRELWTMFLNYLDSARKQDVADYVYSTAALKDAGASKLLLFREAVKLRHGGDFSIRPGQGRSLLQMLPAKPGRWYARR